MTMLVQAWLTLPNFAFSCLEHLRIVSYTWMWLKMKSCWKVFLDNKFFDIKFLDYKSDFTKFGNDFLMLAMCTFSYSFWLLLGLIICIFVSWFLNTATCSIDMKTMQTSGKLNFLINLFVKTFWIGLPFH